MHYAVLYTTYMILYWLNEPIILSDLILLTRAVKGLIQPI